MNYKREIRSDFSVHKKLNMIGKPFKKGHIPWNKGLKGKQVAWNKGLKVRLNPKGEFKKGTIPWNKGLKGIVTAWNKGLKWDEWMSAEGKEKALSNLISAEKGKNHWNWKGGITEQNHLIRNSKEYKEWRKRVFERDRFTCVMCGYRSKKRKDIRADHIKPFSLYPDLRFDVNNGRTLCLACDLKYGWQLFRENNPRKVLSLSE